MSEGHAFQWSPGGLIPCPTVPRDGEAGDAGHQGPLAGNYDMPPHVMAPLPALAAAPVRASQLAYPVKPRPFNVIRETRNRVREIKRELRCHKALQRELAELERLLSAARGKTPAPIQIASRRAG